MATHELLLRAKEVLLHAWELRAQRAILLEEQEELLAAQQCALEKSRRMQRANPYRGDTATRSSTEQTPGMK